MDPALIEQHLKNILASREFANAQRLQVFLKYVVQETLAGRGSRIKGPSIAMGAFGRGSDFDAQDPYVRNIAREVRRALERYYLDRGENDPIRIEIPAGNYMPRFHDHGNQGASSKTLPSAALLPTIAVVPFNTRLADTNHEVLGEVIADEVIRGLSRSDTVQVISQLSTRVFHNRDSQAGEIGECLNSNYVLSGAYRVVGNQVILTAELTDTQTNYLVWADRLLAPVADIVTGEAELIDSLVAGASRAVLAAELQHAFQVQSTATLESHTLMITAIQLMHHAPEGDFQRARQMLETLIQRFPQLATPHAWLGKWHVLQIVRGRGWNIDQQHQGRLALESVQRALDINSQSSLALTISGLIHTILLQRLDLGEDYYTQALAINPNESLAWLFKGTLHAFRGEGETAMEYTEQACHLSPLDPLRYYYDCQAATAALAAGAYPRAVELAQASLALHRNHTSTLRTLAIAQAESGQIPEARKTVEHLLRLDPEFTASSYLQRSPCGPYETGRLWAKALHRAGVPWE